MKLFILIINILLLNQACGQIDTSHKQETNLAEIPSQALNIINTEGKTIQERFQCPNKYIREIVDSNSFAFYLRNLPLKPHLSKVKYYDGSVKSRLVHEAVVDLKIGNKDLHQCADAVMRLRAEYLWKQKQYNKIHFNFTNGFKASYSEWMKGKRIAVKGNRVCWYQKTNPSNTYNTLWSYLERVFTYAGTLSLSKELKTVSINSMQIGDVFIQGGSPGHAVIVVDMATDTLTGKKLFMLAQSYMPAQEIQILKNFKNKDENPWYKLDFQGNLDTPEWTFEKTDLKRFVIE